MFITSYNWILWRLLYSNESNYLLHYDATFWWLYGYPGALTGSILMSMVWMSIDVRDIWLVNRINKNLFCKKNIHNFLNFLPSVKYVTVLRAVALDTKVTSNSYISIFFVHTKNLLNVHCVNWHLNHHYVITSFTG